MNRITSALLGAAVGVAGAAGVLVPRISEVSRVSAILAEGETYAYNRLHVTMDSTDVLLTFPKEYLLGLEGVFNDPEYLRILRVGDLTRGVLYDANGTIRGDVKAVVPIPFVPDRVRVLLNGARWLELERSVWYRLETTL